MDSLSRRRGGLRVGLLISNMKKEMDRRSGTVLMLKNICNFIRKNSKFYINYCPLL